MSKMLKIKLMIVLTAVAVIGGISIKNLPIFHNEYTGIKKSHNSNIKEDYTNDVTVDSQNKIKSDIDKGMNSLSDEKTLSDNSQNTNDKPNKQETVSSNSENKNSNTTNEQKNTNSQLKDTNCNVNTGYQGSTDESLSTSSQLKEIDDKNTESQDTNGNLEEKKSTFHYDRTTSIYDDDKITLLRVEYYVNNKLTYYSEIEQFDAATKSYIEHIYQCNLETNIDPLIRTDVYKNGTLTKSY